MNSNIKLMMVKGRMNDKRAELYPNNISNNYN